MESAVFLDLDETVLSVSSERTFVAHLRKDGKIGFGRSLLMGATFVAHAAGLISDYHRTKRRVCRILLEGASVDEMHHMALSFVRDERGLQRQRA